MPCLLVFFCSFLVGSCMYIHASAAVVCVCAHIMSVCVCVYLWMLDCLLKFGVWWLVPSRDGET